MNIEFQLRRFAAVVLGRRVLPGGLAVSYGKFCFFFGSCFL